MDLDPHLLPCTGEDSSGYGQARRLCRPGPKVFQTGEYDAPRRGISKRGSPHLRKTLWMMAWGALQQNGELRDYWLRKRREGTRHFVVVTAAAAKLCRAPGMAIVGLNFYGQ